jgi:hypothetical protein
MKLTKEALELIRELQEKPSKAGDLDNLVVAIYRYTARS